MKFKSRGLIELNGLDIHNKEVDVAQLRRRVGMVFQRPNPFPKSIFENVAYGLRLNNDLSKSEIEDRVEWALKSAAIWNEVNTRLRDTALGLSGGQQQRLVIARAIAVKTGRTTPRRTRICLRPDFNVENRRTDRPTQDGIYNHHRHSQHATSSSSIGFHGIYVFR